MTFLVPQFVPGRYTKNTQHVRKFLKNGLIKYRFHRVVQPSSFPVVILGYCSPRDWIGQHSVFKFIPRSFLGSRP